MPRLAAFFFALAALLAGPAAGQPAALEAPGPGPAFVVPVEGTVDNALARYVDRALAEAEAAEAAAVLFRINTFGGLVDAADQIRTAILHATVPTAAFVDPNAASAGALIAYANDRILMAPAASMGAATAVDASGAYASEKVQSYMRSLMRATAEAKGRDPRIAEAMVDERLAIPDVVAEGSLLALSASEALRLGVADAVAGSEAEALAALGLEGREVVHHHATRLEQVLRFLGSPVVASLLMLMMLGGLYFELQTPGVGFAGAMALLGALLFFAPHYALGLVESWEIVLFVLGVLLLLAEVFVLPGFGVVGVAGIVLIVFSLGAALIGNVGLAFPGGGEITRAIVTLAATLVLLVILGVSLGRYLPRSERFRHLVLVPELASAEGYTSAETDETLLGERGVALTPLRPSGTAEIAGRRVDVVAEGVFVPAGEAVEVVSARGSRVVVRPARDVPAA